MNHVLGAHEWFQKLLLSRSMTSMLVGLPEHRHVSSNAGDRLQKYGSGGPGNHIPSVQAGRFIPFSVIIHEPLSIVI